MLNKNFIKPVGKLKPLDSVSKEEIKPVGKLKDISEKQYEVEGVPLGDVNNYTEVNGRDKIKEWVDKDPLLQDNLGVGGNKAGTLKKLIDNNATPEQIKNSYLTLTNRHPHQEGVGSYYVNESGEAVPLKLSERPPAGYDVASVWGNKDQANDDAWYTTLAKHAYNIIPGVMENVADVIQLPNVLAQKLSTDIGMKEFLSGQQLIPEKYKPEEAKIKDAEWYKSTKNIVNSLKATTSDKSKESILNTENIHKISDIAKADNWKFTADNIVGTIGGLAQSVGEFVAGGELTKPLALAGETALANKAVTQLSKAGTKSNLLAASYMTQFGDVLDAAKNAGLNTEDAYKFASTITIPLALVDMGLGVEGKIFKDQVANAEKKNLIKGIVDGFVKDTDGKITKEALDDAFNVTTAANTSLAKTWLKETGKTSLEEGGQEALQSFIQKAGEQIHDKLSTGDDKKFGTDALSAQSFAQYLQEGISGALGGAPTALAYDKIKAINRDENQSKSAFELVKKGETAIDAFKQNLEKQFADGNITKEQKENALLKVESYNDYNRLITNKNLNIDDTKKRELFDKTFQKENLESQIKSMGDIGKLNPIDLGEFKGLEKQAHDLQKDINEIIFSSQIKNETTVGDKSIEHIEKTEHKPKEKESEVKLPNELQLLKDKYKKSDKVEETRSYSEIPNNEFNSPRMNARTIHAKVVEHLDEKPEKQVVGNIKEVKFSYNGKNNNRFVIALPDGKEIRMASSMERPEKFRGHMRTEHLTKEKDLEGLPVGVKLETLKDGKKAIKIYNLKSGKFLSWAKETNTGRNLGKELTPEQIDELAHLETIIEPPSTNVTNININPINTTPTNEQTTITEGTTKGEISKTNGNGINPSQRTKTFKVGTKKSNRTIKHQGQLNALKHDVYDPKDLAQQYFIGGGEVNTDSIRKLFKNSIKELNARISYRRKTALSIEQIAEKIVNDNENLNLDYNDVRNAVEDVVISFNSPSQMANDLNNRFDLKEQRTPNEIVIDNYIEEAQKQGVETEFNKIIDSLEKLPDEDLNDIITNDDLEDQFQRLKLNTEEKELIKESGENEDDFLSTRNFFDKEYQEKGLPNIGEGKGADFINDENNVKEETVLIEELIPTQRIVEKSAIGKKGDGLPVIIRDGKKLIVLDGHHRIATEVENGKTKIKANVFDITGLNIPTYEDSSDNFQKTKTEKGNIELARHEAILKVTEHIQKVLPKIKVIYNTKLKAAGVLRAGGKQIEINPYYADIDTPIHEAGHVLIDTIGYNNKVIQAAINQLKGTKLYSETKERYPELSEEMLNKEVLAEAIGREGADIFEKEADKSKFKQYLDYIFNWLKTKLGINKNIAKSLAKQIIGGIGTKNITSTESNVEQLQKEKETEQSFDDYRKEELERDIIQQQKDLETIEKYLADENISDEDKDSLEETKEAILDQIKEDKAEFDLYTMGIAKAEEILTAKDLEKYTVDELIEGYNTAIKMKDSRKRADIMKRIAFYFNESRRQELRKFDEFIDKDANKSDLRWRDVQFRVLSHMTENFPELQKLNEVFDEAYFNKVSESNKMKKELEKKAKAVIKEANKKLGIGERVLHLFHSNNAKYFDYMDENGKFRENTTGLTDAQKDLLNYMKELFALKNKQYDENGEEITQDQILKIDKSFAEEFKTEGLMSAISHYFGGSNFADVEVNYTNPNTNRKETVPYLEAQKSILDYSKKGLTNKLIALPKLLSIAYKAKKQGAKPAYAFNYNGLLSNKFDAPRPKDAGYSKDFYRAALMFIDDYAHVKNMNKLVPIVNSLDYLYSRGYGDVLKKPNAKKWLEEWSQAQIYQSNSVTDPILDASLKFIRTLTSQIVMGFNVPASVMNVFMGNYNNWRVANGKDILKGNKRLFGKDGLNKYGLDLIDKFDVVKADKDSNPKFGVGKLFQKLAFGAQSIGELQIQGSMFLGQLTEDEWNSFEYNDKGELVFKKDANQKEIIKKFNEYKNKISDIQGKYSEKDRINFLRSEWGKTIGQFKVWMPTALKERFGAKYIDYKGEVKQGTFNGLIADGFKEIREDIKRDGIKGFLNNKNAMANLKGLMAITFFAILAHQDDEDESVRKKALSANNALGNLLFVFDIDQMKYMAKSPVASLGTLQKFLDVSEALLDMDSKKLKKTTPKIVPYGKAYTQIEKIFEEE